MPSSSTTSPNAQYAQIKNQESRIKLLRLSVQTSPCSLASTFKRASSSQPLHFQITHFISLLRQSHSVTLSHFPALAGRLSTNSDGHISILCNNAGVDFIHAKATFLSVNSLLSPIDIPDSFKEFFAFLASFQSFFPAFGFFSAALSWKT